MLFHFGPTQLCSMMVLILLHCRSIGARMISIDKAVTQESISENSVLADATETFEDSDSSEIASGMPTEISDDAKKGDPL